VYGEKVKNCYQEHDTILRASHRKIYGDCKILKMPFVGSELGRQFNVRGVKIQTSPPKPEQTPYKFPGINRSTGDNFPHLGTPKSNATYSNYRIFIYCRVLRQFEEIFYYF